MPIKNVPLTHEQETRLSNWLLENLEDIEERRTARMTQWRKWRDQYEGKVQAKDFPWKNASNVHVPLTAIDTDAIHANMMNRIFSHDRIWDVNSPKPAEKIDHESQVS